MQHTNTGQIERAAFAGSPLDTIRTEDHMDEMFEDVLDDADYPCDDSTATRAEYLEDDQFFVADLPDYMPPDYDQPTRFLKKSAALALYWLGGKLELDEQFDLAGLINTLHFQGSASHYSEKVICQTKNGHLKARLLNIPQPDLAFVQRRISRKLLPLELRHQNSHGYLGSNCQNALAAHSSARSMLMFDVKDAFFKVGRETLQRSLMRKGFGWYVSSFLCDLCLCYPVQDWVKEKFGAGSEFLPQGAPTSAKLFDVSFWWLDHFYTKFAKRHGGTYSRYADNIYLSLPKEEFPEALQKIALTEAARVGFPPHKIRKISNGRLCHALGLNLRDGVVSNTKAFRRSLRGALHHLLYVIDHDYPLGYALQKVSGCMSFAVREQLPSELQEMYKVCMERIQTI
jgi:hypothetical protein